MTILAYLSVLLLAAFSAAAPVNLALTVRQETCSNEDAACWNRNGLTFTNAFRAENSRGSLVAGPPSMLENAVAHSRRMAASNDIFHQDLAAAGREVGCNLFISRENVAAFGGRGTFSGKGASRQFLDQWINSPGHRANLLGAEDGNSLVVGVFVAERSTYGTQVFATGVSDCSDTAAEAVSEALATMAPAAMAPATMSPATMPPPATEPATTMATEAVTEVATGVAAEMMEEASDPAATQAPATNISPTAAVADQEPQAADLESEDLVVATPAANPRANDVTTMAPATKAIPAEQATPASVSNDTTSTGRRTLVLNSLNEIMCWLTGKSSGSNY